MKKRTIGFIGIILVLAVGIGAGLAVPTVFAETKLGTTKQAGPVICAATKTGLVGQAVPAKPQGPAKRILTAADKANLLALKTLEQQIGAAAKLIRAKVVAAKAAGTDLTTFTADLKTAKLDATHRAVSQGVMLTETERTTLATLQTAIRTLEQQFKTQKKAKVAQATLDALKVQLKAAITARTMELKTIHAAARTDYSSRLVILIADANAKLTFLQGLLLRLP